VNHCTWNRVSWQISSIRNSLGQRHGLPFVDLLTPDMLRKVAGKAAESSEPIYTPLVTLWMFLGQVVDPDHSCRQAVARLLVWLTLQGQPPCCAETGAYCKARVRLSEEHLHGLVRATGAELHGKAQTDWLWKGRRVKIADGTTLIMPDTEANQAEYPQPDGQKPGLGFPMVRKEIWAHFLAYNLIRGMIAQASVEHGRTPCQISFKGAMQTLNAFQHVLLTSPDVAETYERLLKAIATHRVGDRPGRVEPRAKKRRKKNYPVLTQPRALAKKRLVKTT